MGLLIAGGSPASAHVDHDEAGDTAPRIGLVGDSSLAGVRWYSAYGDLEDYNFRFDAESCRRTFERSCWSREGYRPDNAVLALQQHSGQWGDLLVVMTGYNDTSYLFDDAIDAIVDEAQRQGIPQVMWLTLRVADVNYEEPLHQANGDTYGEANRMLFDKAEEYGGYLQIADWATHSAERHEWFAGDGVHLDPDGARALTAFIAENVSMVLDGDTVTPAHPPWATLDIGDTGDVVADVQQALLDAGVETVGEVDGVYGEVTATAVRELQTARGLQVTGTVDVATAVALELYEEPGSIPGGDSERPHGATDGAMFEQTATGFASPPMSQGAQVPGDPDGGSFSPITARSVGGAAVAILTVLLLFAMRRRTLALAGTAPMPGPVSRADAGEDDMPPDETYEMAAPDDAWLDDLAFDDDVTFEMARPWAPERPYDYESEDALTR